MDNRHWRDKWEQSDLDLLTHKREVEKKTFIAIAEEMQRPEGSCWRRYTQIVAAREPAPSIIPADRPRRLSFHEQMGIKTYTHMQAILFDPAGRLGNSRREFGHSYRMPITLAKIG
jgi:hypothetical protein